MTEVVELLQDHGNTSMWHTNLRSFSTAKHCISKPPQTASNHDELMTMKKNTRYTTLSKGNDVR